MEPKDTKVPTEEEEWATCLSKARKSRDLLVSSPANLEEEMSKAASNQRLSKGTKKDGGQMMVRAHNIEKKLKELLLKQKRPMSLTKAKDLIKDATQAAKDMKDMKKEVSVVAHKAQPRAESHR